jgi:hypothetical protein
MQQRALLDTDVAVKHKTKHAATPSTSMHHRTGCRTSVGIGLFRADCKRHHGNNGMVSRATVYAQRMQMILEMRLHLLGDANALRRNSASSGCN